LFEIVCFEALTKVIVVVKLKQPIRSLLQPFIPDYFGVIQIGLRGSNLFGIESLLGNI
jgi:hypothetical protein